MCRGWVGAIARKRDAVVDGAADFVVDHHFVYEGLDKDPCGLFVARLQVCPEVQRIPDDEVRVVQEHQVIARNCVEFFNLGF